MVTSFHHSDTLSPWGGLFIINILSQRPLLHPIILYHVIFRVFLTILSTYNYLHYGFICFLIIWFPHMIVKCLRPRSSLTYSSKNTSTCLKDGEINMYFCLRVSNEGQVKQRKRKGNILKEQHTKLPFCGKWRLTFACCPRLEGCNRKGTG